MIIDHRTYTFHPRKIPEFLEIFEREGLPIQLKHLGNLVGYYISTIGTLNQVIHLWGYENLADMETRRAARDADPAWVAYGKKTTGFIICQETKILKPVSFSPVR